MKRSASYIPSFDKKSGIICSFSILPFVSCMVIKLLLMKVVITVRHPLEQPGRGGSKIWLRELSGLRMAVVDLWNTVISQTVEINLWRPAPRQMSIDLYPIKFYLPCSTINGWWDTNDITDRNIGWWYMETKRWLYNKSPILAVLIKSNGTWSRRFSTGLAAGVAGMLPVLTKLHSGFSH